MLLRIRHDRLRMNHDTHEDEPRIDRDPEELTHRTSHTNLPLSSGCRVISTKGLGVLSRCDRMVRRVEHYTITTAHYQVTTASPRLLLRAHRRSVLRPSSFVRVGTPRSSRQTSPGGRGARRGEALRSPCRLPALRTPPLSYGLCRGRHPSEPADELAPTRL